MADSDDGPRHTDEDHREYLGRVRDLTLALGHLVDAAPCPYTLGHAVLMVRLLHNRLQTELALETAMQDFENSRQMGLKGRFWLN